MDFTGRLTPQGEALLTAAMANDAPLTITRVTAGGGVTAASATALADPRQEATISQRTTDGSLATIMVTLAAAMASQDYTLTELGVYAQGAGEAELLYQVFRLDQPISISPDSRLVLRAYLRLAVSDDLEVRLALPPSGLLVEADVRNKADLIGGQVPYVQTPHLTGDKVLYVDAAAGDDANPGTQSQPYKTIQAAVDSLPKDLGNASVRIYLAEGTYNEDVVIQGFMGGDSYYPLNLTGSTAGQSTAHKVRSLRLSNCVPRVQLAGFSVTGVGEQNCAVEAEGCSVRMVNMICDNQDQVPDAIGVLSGQYHATTIYMVDTSVNGYIYGLKNYTNAMATVNTCGFSHCTSGIFATSSIVFSIQNTYTENQTNTVVENFARIFESY